MIVLTETVERHFSDSARFATEALPGLVEPIVNGACLIVESLLQGGKILCCGNGGSAAQAQYFASLMLNHFDRERPALPAVALSADSTVLTAIPNTFDFDELFARQIKGLGQSRDLLLAICVQGEMENINAAIQAAQEQQMGIIVLSGGEGERLTRLLRSNDIEIRVPRCPSPRTRELHLLIIHSLCELIDQQLLGT